MRRTVVVACAMLIGAMAWPQAAVAQDRVIGLLALPTIWGTGDCERFTPRPVALRDAPFGRTVGAVVVVTPMTDDPASGGCEGLTVGVRTSQAAPVQPLPTLEYGYERPGAVVLERRAHWYRVRLDSGSAWLESAASQDFYSIEQLLESGLTYLTRAWDGRVSAAPGAPPRLAKVPESNGHPVPVAVHRVSRGRAGLWLLIDIMSSACAESEPTIVDQGWVPAYGTSDETTIWFHSRGC